LTHSFKEGRKEGKEPQENHVQCRVTEDKGWFKPSGFRRPEVRRIRKIARANPFHIWKRGEEKAIIHVFEKLRRNGSGS